MSETVDRPASTIESTRHFVAKTRIVSLATAGSRLLGVVREQVIAFYFGAGAVTDAFVAAFRIPNLLRDLLAEGAFSAAFVPTFSDVLHKQGKGAARELLSRVLGVFVPTLAILSILGIIFTPQIASLLSGGVEETPGKFALLIHLARWMFPFLLLIALAAAMMGALNALGKFGLPALAPAGFNIGMILCAAFLSPMVDPPVLALAWGVLAGGFLQYAIQAVALSRLGFSHRLSPVAGWKDPYVRQIGRLLLPSLLGQAAVQINILVVTRSAWQMGDGPVAYLNFAFRILFVPLGVFAVAASTVGLARISRMVAAGDATHVRATLNSGLRTVLFLVTPTAIAFILLGVPITAALYERGQFTPESTLHTARALALYALGLPAMAAVRVVAPIFFAHKDTRTPTLCGILSVLLNLGGIYVLAPTLGYAGLALSVGIAATVQAAVLVAIAEHRYGPFQLGSIAGHWTVMLLLAFVSVAPPAWLLASGGMAVFPFGVVGQTLLAVAGAGALYFGLAWLCGYRHLGSERRLRKSDE